MRLDFLARDLDPDSPQPMALQIARAVAGAIQRGDLRPGEALPGTRDLAEALGASRYAVLGALRELEMEGFVTVRPASGARVAEHPPALPQGWGGAPPHSKAEGGAPGFALSSHLAPITALGGADFDLSLPEPDPRLAPQKALARAYQRALDRHGDDLLAPGEPKGNALLRSALADFLREHRGLRVDPEQLLVVPGHAQALALLGEALFRRGGRIAVEAPGDPLLREGLGRPGLEWVDLPCDGAGADPEVLRRALRGDAPPTALALQPVAQVPTGSTLAPERRRAFLELAAAHRLAVLEEDSGFAFREDGTAPLPLAAEDTGGHGIYRLPLGRILAPGLGLTAVAGPRALVDRLARLRRDAKLPGDRVLEWAVGDLIRDGDLARALRRNVRIYGAQAAALAAALGARLAGALEVAGRSARGLWLRPCPGFPLEAWIQACAGRGVRLGSAAEGGVFLSVCTVDEARLPDLLARLEEARKGL